jgi:hypothetical protein
MTLGVICRSRRLPTVEGMRRVLLSAAALVAAASAGAAVAATPSMPPASQFSPRVDNPWLPLKLGSRYVYTGVKDGKPVRDVLTVSRRTVRIAGVPCAVVEDRLYSKGRLSERTTDWYSQDARGNVWYLGEQTAELDARGRVVSTAGTWKTGVKGAEAGLFMPAHPQVGQSARQEYWQGQAEDHFQVVARLGRNALLTKEWTPLEPGVLDHKLYVYGVGTVVEQTVKGGNERLELVSLTHGR